MELFLQHKRKRARVIPYLMLATAATKGASHLRQCLGHLQSESDGLSVGRDTHIVLPSENHRYLCPKRHSSETYTRCVLPGGSPVTGDEPDNWFLKPTEDDILGAQVLFGLGPVPEQAFTD